MSGSSRIRVSLFISPPEYNSAVVLTQMLLIRHGVPTRCFCLHSSNAHIFANNLLFKVPLGFSDVFECRFSPTFFSNT